MTYIYNKNIKRCAWIDLQTKRLNNNNKQVNSVTTNYF